MHLLQDLCRQGLWYLERSRQLSASKVLFFHTSTLNRRDTCLVYLPGDTGYRLHATQLSSRHLKYVSVGAAVTDRKMGYRERINLKSSKLQSGRCFFQRSSPVHNYANLGVGRLFRRILCVLGLQLLLCQEGKLCATAESWSWL